MAQPTLPCNASNKGFMNNNLQVRRLMYMCYFEFIKRVTKTMKYFAYIACGFQDYITVLIRCTLKNEAASSSETLIATYVSVWVTPQKSTT